MTVRLRLFGILRKLSESGEIELKVESGSTVADLQNALIAYVRSVPEKGVDSRVVLESVVASEKQVLSRTDSLEHSTGPWAILPPVCGG